MPLFTLVLQSRNFGISAYNTTTDESSTNDEQAVVEENNSSAPHTPHHEQSYASPALCRESLDL